MTRLAVISEFDGEPVRYARFFLDPERARKVLEAT
jgi:hypothetical protein